MRSATRAWNRIVEGLRMLRKPVASALGEVLRGFAVVLKSGVTSLKTLAMLATRLSLSVGVAIGRAVIRVLGLHVFLPWRPERISLSQRQDAGRRLSSTANLHTADTAKTILSQVLLIVDRAVDGNRNLEAKANGVIVLSTALIGFGVSFGASHAMPAPPIAMAALAFLVAAIFLAGMVNDVETHDLPSPVIYNLPTIANDPNNDAKISLELAEAWNNYAIDENGSGVTKGRWLGAAFMAMKLGVALFVVVGSLALLGSHVGALDRNGKASGHQNSAVSGRR